jgi:tetratricopeptide (TPR) repeat protein
VITTIEENKRFSKSLLWQLQRKFFSQQGAKAWSNGIVPHYMTSNPYIAQAYAQVMFGWVRDIADDLDTSQPVYIVELGAGSGRLAYHFLKFFFEFFDQSVLRDIPITYVMTDFTKTTLQFWEDHQQLKPWVASGRLDFAMFDAEQDKTFTLINQGIQLTSDTLKNPLGLIANYFFDGLRQDVFRFRNGSLQESLVTLRVEEENPDLENPNLLLGVVPSFGHRPTSSSNYYDDSDFNALLHVYETTLNQTTVLFPIGSLECLQRLLELSNNNLFWLTGDKGYHHESDLEYRGEPGLTIHGSFSMMVNYHAIGEYVKSQDGQFLSTPHHHASLDICGILFGENPHDYPETRLAYFREIIKNNPDDFYTLKKSVDPQGEEFDVKQFLASLRLSGWDSSVFIEYFPLLLPVLDNVSAGIREDLNLVAKHVWEMYFYIGEDHDLAFMLGGLLYGLEYYEEAVEYLHHSLELSGDHAITFCNIATCHYDLNDLDLALECVMRSLNSDPTFEPAQVLKEKIIKSSN